MFGEKQVERFNPNDKFVRYYLVRTGSRIDGDGTDEDEINCIATAVDTYR